MKTGGLALLLLTACTGVPEPREETVAVPGTEIRIEMVLVPGGRLRMGDRVVEVRPFWISKREATWGEFNPFYDSPEEERVDGVTRPSRGKDFLGLSGIPPDFLGEDRPVTNLKIHSALAYAEWISWKTGQAFRLPTEAEWEFACRAGSAEPEPLGDHAWFEGNSEGKTHRGGGKRPNAFGLHDMLGNVWEYCLEPARPPEFGPVLRGGAWNTPAADLRADRRKTVPGEWLELDPSRPFSVWWFRGDFTQGFRLVRVAGAAGREEREAGARKIEIRGLEGREQTVREGGSVSSYHRVRGEVRNGGDRAIDELGIKVYCLAPGGKPHLKDVMDFWAGRATWGVVYPVLPNSAHPGDHARPLRPGETRAFVVDIPATFDDEEAALPGRFGGSVLSLRFGPE